MSPRSLLQRTAIGAVVGLVATVVYRSIQYVFVARAEIRHECWTWRWLPFDAAWIWPYLSMFLLVGLPWFLLPTGREVRRFAVCLLATAAVGWVVFMVYPTGCARPTAEGQPGYYALLLALDRPNNCLPCLHVAFSVLAAYALVRCSPVFRHLAGAVFLGIWLLTICVSVVALRQHSDGDMLAGAALGCVSAGLFHRTLRGPDRVSRGEA